MLYAEICPKDRRHNARPYSPSGRALCLLTLGHISAYNMDNTILLYDYFHNINRAISWGGVLDTTYMCSSLSFFGSFTNKSDRHDITKII